MCQGRDIRLRAITEKDLAKLVEWDKDEEISKWAGTKFSGHQEAREWYLEKPAVSKKTFGIETLDGKLIGEIEILNVSWRLHTGELRIVIGEKEYWNRGIGTDAVLTFVKWVFANYSIKTIYLRVYEYNRRARKCYVKAGFRAVGKVKLRTESCPDPVPAQCCSTHLILMEVTKEAFLESACS